MTARDLARAVALDANPEQPEEQAVMLPDGQTVLAPDGDLGFSLSLREWLEAGGRDPREAPQEVR